MQGIWSASAGQATTIEKPLYSDASSGILFNLTGQVAIGAEVLPQGVFVLPVTKHAQHIVMPSGAELAGIRFHPAVGYGLFREHFHQPRLLPIDEGHLYGLYDVYDKLKNIVSHDRRIALLYAWGEAYLDLPSVIPGSLAKALEAIEQGKKPSQLGETVELSQRQIERMFKLWLDMTPKRYQRILRIKQVIEFLRSEGSVSLADVAQQFGFSDQAHMTREFRAIGDITPGKMIV